MKRFVIQVIVFFAIVAVIDVACGYGFRYMETHAKGGFTLRDKFISKELNTDVILYGSSRCVHHYNPQIIEDSLGMTCYNAGQDGNGIILTYGRLLMQNRRKVPKIIVCDIHPEFDLMVSDNHRFFQWLKSYYDQEGIKEIFYSIDIKEKYKMLSNLYRYNSRFLEITTDYVHPMHQPKANGFVPHDNGMNKSKIKPPIKQEKLEFDEIKLNYIEKFIDESKDSKLVFVVSPIWYGMDERMLVPLREICQRKGVKLVEFENSPKYVHNDYYFHDGNHMSHRGADEFTRELIQYIK
jgi:hypothetical protein